MAYSCCFSLGGNLDFLEFLQKKFYNINYRYLKAEFILVGEPLPEQRSRQRQAEGERRVAQLPHDVLPQQRSLPFRLVRAASGRI